MGGRKSDFTLSTNTLDDLFSSQEERDEAKKQRITEIPLELIDPFPSHPFKVIDDEEMFNLAESIKEYGVMTPAIVRRKEDGRYEMVAGHRRKRGCELAGLKTLRAEVLDINRDEATIFMVDSNLQQRTKLLPSEKAFSYKMRLEAMKRQGKRTDLTCAPVEHKLRKSRDVLANEVGESREQIRRYIRLTELIPNLLTMVDEEKIALRPAVELSYISHSLQEKLCEMIDMEQCTPSHAQTIRMHKLFEKGALTEEVMLVIMQEEKPNQREKLVIRDSRVQKLLPRNLPVSKREEYIIRALEYYGKYREKMKKEQER